MQNKPAYFLKQHRWILLLTAVILLTGNSLQAAEEDIDLGPVTEKHVMIPMRDGIKLSAYLYFPKGEGPWPVLYEQRYVSVRSPGSRQYYARLAAGGYVVCIESFRGAQLSEGTWIGYRSLGLGKHKDGYDTVEWLAKQPWSTGKVGSFGGSQGGFAQNFLATSQPPHLVCQYMRDTGLSLFHEGYRIGGATKPERFKAGAVHCRNPDDHFRLIEKWFKHPNYDKFWAAENCALHFDKMNYPCFMVGSWYDYMCVGSVQSFAGRQHRGGPKSRGKQQLRIGPWLHGRVKNTNRTGEMVYPENAKFAKEAHMIRWFDHYLKGIDNGIEKDPTVQYYVMGAVGEKGAPGNVWKTAKNWPVPAKETAYFLHADKSLSITKPDAKTASTTFLSDPLHPAEIPGRNFPGARDARAFEKQKEVRTFTTEVLNEPVEWTGKVKAELYVSSSARDTDFLVRVSDVYPDGRSILIMDSIRRARYRKGFEQEVLMQPGKVYRLAFDVGWLSQSFNKGHRIRVTVASTGAPFYEPNPNTGGPQTIELPKDAVVAENTVHLSQGHASRIIAPVQGRK